MEREIMDPTFSAPEIIFDLQNKKFCDMVSICYERHPYYRRWFGESGVRLESIRGLKDLSKVPLVSKTEFMADPEAFRLEPKGPDELLWDVAYSPSATCPTAHSPDRSKQPWCSEPGTSSPCPGNPLPIPASTIPRTMLSV